MSRLISLILIAGVLSIPALTRAADESEFDELQRLMDSARVLEAPIFAPKNWAMADRAFQDASTHKDMQRQQKYIDKDVAKAREYVENAVKATEVCRLSLQQYLEPRKRAIDARAPSLVTPLYDLAETQFMKATEKVESGDVKGALKEADKASPMFATAELEAIRTDILGTADKLIAKAVVDDAEKFALSTLDRARSYRERANTVITGNRYNRDEAPQQAVLDEYEARHASNIALSVRALNKNDQAWEKLMLVYEIQMNRVGGAMGVEHLPFDNGPLAAADSIISYVRALQAENQRLTGQMKDLSGNVTSDLQKVMHRFGDSTEEADPIKLTAAIDRKVTDLITENANLSGHVDSLNRQFAQLEQAHEQVSEKLASRVEREEKFKQAKQKLNPSEGEVLFNASNDIVLRLSGLSFDVGKSEIEDQHVPLLEKVKEVIEMFPDAKVRVEGHTDASGEETRNVLLSEKRALAVMQYLRQSLLISADRISSVGYGSERPVASNQSDDGRAKNRRIDVIIMQ